MKVRELEVDMGEFCKDIRNYESQLLDLMIETSNMESRFKRRADKDIKGALSNSSKEMMRYYKEGLIVAIKYEEILPVLMEDLENQMIESIKVYRKLKNSLRGARK